jgi:hypothetical protein
MHSQLANRPQYEESGGQSTGRWRETDDCSSHLFLGTYAKFREVTINFVVFVCLSTHPHGQILIKFNISAFFQNSVEKIQVWLKSDKNNEYFMRTYVCWILLKMRNVQHRSCKENQKTHFMIKNIFLEIMPFMG